jgi:hypothetical protein
MSLDKTPSVEHSEEYSRDTLPVQTEFEFMSASERLQRINQRIRKFSGQRNREGEPQERCCIVNFTLDAQRVTEARRMIISLCKEKLVFMRVSPMRNAPTMQIELFLSTSIAQRVKEIIRSNFQCRTTHGSYIIDAR